MPGRGKVKKDSEGARLTSFGRVSAVVKGRSTRLAWAHAAATIGVAAVLASGSCGRRARTPESVGRVEALALPRLSPHAYGRAGDLVLHGSENVALTFAARDDDPGHRPLKGALLDVDIDASDRADPLLWWRPGWVDRHREPQIHALVAKTVSPATCADQSAGSAHRRGRRRSHARHDRVRRPSRTIRRDHHRDGPPRRRRPRRRAEPRDVRGPPRDGRRRVGGRANRRASSQSATRRGHAARSAARGAPEPRSHRDRSLPRRARPALRARGDAHPRGSWPATRSTLSRARRSRPAP